MTVETRIVAPIDDIKHVELTCSEQDCMGRLFVDLDCPVRSEQRCPKCNVIWWMRSISPDQKPHPVFAVLSALISHRNRARQGDPGFELILPGPP